MNPDFYSKHKVTITLGAALIVLVHLLIEHFHGRVVTHYLMQSDALPGISNWWGLITFPAAVWIVLTRIQKRASPNSTDAKEHALILYRLLSGIFFGVLVSYLFSIESSVLDYLMLALIGLSIFMRLYFGEYLIGFILGGMYVFGANILLIGGSVLILIFLSLYKIPRMVFKLFRSKT